MKEILNNAIRKLLCSVLTIAMVLFNSIAVFADDNELTVYKAEYDAETEEVSFETEQTGDFVIVQFKYEDEPFTEEFYKALAELKEIKGFLAVIEEERA